MSSLVALCLALLAAPPNALDAEPVVLPLRSRAELRDRWLARRLDTLVPRLMRREGIDMWVVVSREYNEDPLFITMAPAVATVTQNCVGIRTT